MQNQDLNSANQSSTIDELLRRCNELSVLNELNAAMSLESHSNQGSVQNQETVQSYDVEIERADKRMLSKLDIRLTASYRLGNTMINGLKRPLLKNLLQLPYKLIRLFIELKIQQKYM